MKYVVLSGLTIPGKPGFPSQRQLLPPAELDGTELPPEEFAQLLSIGVIGPIGVPVEHLKVDPTAIPHDLSKPFVKK